MWWQYMATRLLGLDLCQVQRAFYSALFEPIGVQIGRWHMNCIHMLLNPKCYEYVSMSIVVSSLFSHSFSFVRIKLPWLPLIKRSKPACCMFHPFCWGVGQHPIRSRPMKSRGRSIRHTVRDLVRGHVGHSGTMTCSPWSNPRRSRRIGRPIGSMNIRVLDAVEDKE